MKTKLLNALRVGILLSIPILNFAQAPPLGTASDFVLFSSIGAVGNTGISQITGNVGTNSGAITGFGNVNGVMHTSDGASAQCAADLLIAYNQLNSTVPTFFPAPLLGNGQILNAGVYSISGAATLNLDLSLNAQGDANAVFIFQIQGPFSTNASSKVHLLNGALACNVFWKVEGLVDMAAGTTMRGTVIANNAAINLNTGDTLEGRALSTTGAVNVQGVLAYTPIGCGSPVLTGPAAPALGTTECYAIFSSDGPVSNAGITYVTGDVGTNVGLTTGFNPLFVTGMIHPIPDVSTAQCAADLGIVYTYLNTLPFDIELLYPAQFGNSLVLTPHTYLLNAATSLTDTLYLNAGGYPDAVFVIQINGALTTSTYAKVVLINGTQAKNVYWKIDGAVSINDYSIFNGTIVCNNGAVLLATGVTLNGRAFSTTGALGTTAITATMPPGCNTPSLVPTITGLNSVCQGSTGIVYTTEAEMTGYIWSISSGGTITSGTGTNTILVTWSVPGIQSVGVTYDNAAPVVYPVTVNSLPVPTIMGPATVGVNSVGNIYTTEPGMTGYTWTVSAGGTITAGDLTNAITVSWTIAGVETVTVNYFNLNNCTAVTPAVYNVTVAPPLVPTITGLNSICQGATGVGYTTEAGMTGYIWTISPGGTITSGAATNSILVTWNAAGARWVGITYANATTTVYVVTVNPLPMPLLNGPSSVCLNSENTYTTDANMLNYVWTVTGSGGSIISGQSTNSINVVWNNSGVSLRSIKVTYTAPIGCGPVIPTVKIIRVIQLPAIYITGNAVTYVGSTTYSTLSGQFNYTWEVSSGGLITSGQGTNIIHVTWDTPGLQMVSLDYTNSFGCTAATPMIKNINVLPVKSGAVTESDVTEQPIADLKFEVYPVPNNGQFTVAITSPIQETYTIMVYNYIGIKMLEKNNILVNDQTVQKLDIRPAPTGLYTVVFINGNKQVVRKIIVGQQ